MWPADRLEFERAKNRLRAQLGADSFAAVYDEGLSLTVPAALAGARKALNHLNAS